MRIAGEVTVQAPAQQLWDALLDPAVLVATIPGCERLETTGPHRYAMTVTAGVAAIKGTYAGTCELRDLDEPRSLVLDARGAGAPGTIATEVRVGFTDNQDGTTAVAYDAEATVGGMIGGVGQRILGSVSKRLAREFFDNVEQVVRGGSVAAGSAPTGVASPSSAAGAAEAFTVPPRVAPAGTPRDFLAGVAVGAALVAAGVVLGARAGHRR